MAWDQIVGYNKDSFIDWPGRITSVIFFKGCNLRCKTCHNKRIAYSPEKLKSIPKEEILSDLKSKARSWYDGIVLSGGEVTTIPGIVDWILELKQEVNLPVKIDTNGMAIQVIESLINSNLVDFIAVDIKGPWALYSELTGTQIEPRQIEAIFKEIFYLASVNPDLFYFRTTQVPKLKIIDIEHIRNLIPDGHELHVQPYLP